MGRKTARECPMCGYHGVFISVGHPSRWDSRCPGCGGRERHRLMQLWIDANGGDSKSVRFVELPIPAAAPAIVKLATHCRC